MFDTAMDAAWHALCASLDAAAHASATDPPTGGAHKTAAADHLGAVARAHDVYLTAMCRACWLPDDANSQVCLGFLFFEFGRKGTRGAKDNWKKLSTTPPPPFPHLSASLPLSSSYFR